MCAGDRPHPSDLWDKLTIRCWLKNIPGGFTLQLSGLLGLFTALVSLEQIPLCTLTFSLLF